MTSDLMLLVLAWMLGQRSKPCPSIFDWPGATSPPPPPPPEPKPGDASSTATPLGDLLKGGGGKGGGGGATFDLPEPGGYGPTTLKQAMDLAKAMNNARRAGKKLVPDIPMGPPAPTLTTMNVKEIQQALISHGAPLKPDGLYGPKTQAAWVTIASSKKLNPTIVRVSAKSAKVSPNTFTSLSVPPIP